MTRRHVPTAAQGFGFLGLLMALAYGIGWVQANWSSIANWLTSAAPWWFLPLCAGLAVFGLMAVVLWDALRPRGGA